MGKETIGSAFRGASVRALRTFFQGVAGAFGAAPVLDSLTALRGYFQSVGALMIGVVAITIASFAQNFSELLGKVKLGPRA